MSDAGDPPAQILTERAACTSALLELLAAADRELCLLSHALDARIYGSEPTGAIKRFLLSSTHTRMQVLVADPQLAAAQGSAPLIELGRRLSSRVEFREPSPLYVPLKQGEWLIGDGRALLERSLEAGAPARYWPQAPQRARRRRAAFSTQWELSTPAAALRALHL